MDWKDQAQEIFGRTEIQGTYESANYPIAVGRGQIAATLALVEAVEKLTAAFQHEGLGEALGTIANATPRYQP